MKNSVGTAGKGVIMKEVVGLKGGQGGDTMPGYGH